MRSISILLVTAIGITSVTATTTIKSFDLTDQHQKLRRYHFPKSKLTVMAVTDHKGSAELKPWITCVHDRFGSAIDIDGIADVSTVPSPLVGVARMIFRKQLDYSVMLDWNGSIVRQFEYEKATPNLYLLDFDGAVIGRVSGSAQPDRIDHFFKMITVSLDQRRVHQKH